MLFLFLIYHLIQSNPGDVILIPSIGPRTDVSCIDQNNGRTTWNIVWSCFSTIFLCTWVTLQPNIAITRDTRGVGWFKKLVAYPLQDFMKNKLPLFLCGLLAPEYLLGWAARQYLMAGQIQQRVSGWTRTHGFFVIMGGFHLYRLPDDALSNPYPPDFGLPTEFAILQPLTPHMREEEVAEHPLKYEDLSIPALIYLAPSKTEIMDKGKADVLAKVFTLAQTLWFVAQCMARGAKKLPLTELEVVTLAYATMNLCIYYFWWDKPTNVDFPIRIYKTSKAESVVSRERSEWLPGALGIFHRIYAYIGGAQDNFVRLRDEPQVPLFWSGSPGDDIAAHTMLGAFMIGIVFGAMHFISWHSQFPSHIEILIWRISCIIITAISLIVTVNAGVREMELQDSEWTELVSFVAAILTPFIALIYLFARMATLVIALTTLRALPLAAFQTVDWTTFIPHL